MPTAEHRRLAEPSTSIVPPWRRWGCYVSERAWGTVREDYSPYGDAWNHLPHNQARSKAYRWGEDGIAGLCDRYQLLIFSLGLWNGRDPILKERLFGLTSSEGNRGEDVKEYYFYLDAMPTGSYMKLLYKYPQAEYPYGRLLEENRRRGGGGMEFELLDSGVFEGDRYFDVVVEYAKADPEDICVRVEVFNRGPEDAPIHVLPHLWFRNTWGWGPVRGPQPEIRRGASGQGFQSLAADDAAAQPLPNLMFDYRLGTRHLYAPDGGFPLFTDNETNAEAVYGPAARSASEFTKDAFHRRVVYGDASTNPAEVGTKACVHYQGVVPAHSSLVWHLRLTPGAITDPLADVERLVTQRRSEADEFYAAIHPPQASADERLVQRQALAGMLWTRQIYLFDVSQWLDGDDPRMPPPASRRRIRNASWRHLNSMRILSMPDKWEYPWFAAWDLAFHCVAIALVDPAFAKDNLWLLLFEQFQHPNGQIPAYEWEFSDLNPPVHAWACWRVYNLEKERTGKSDVEFLEKCFQKLLINFAWWVNKVDSQGMNVFEGGFLGLDNITVVDRSERLPDGAILEQSDATGWMGFFCLHMMRIAIELSAHNRVYEGMATKFFQHFIYIGGAMKKMGGRDYQLWDEEDGFFYDVLRYRDGSFHKFEVRSLVGLIPLFAIDVLEEDKIDDLPFFFNDVHWFIRNRPDLVGQACYTETRDGERRDVLSIVDRHQLTRLLQRVWDESEFLSVGGIRSLSKFHEHHPFTFGAGTVRYEPAEADVKIKGGNSNWRGPIWFPTSYLLIESLQKFGAAHGPGFAVPTPASGGTPIAPGEMAREVANRMISMFTRGADGRRRIYGGTERFQTDPYWRDCLLFNEYFHGDNGAGLGANHQTGWTGLVANLIDEWRR
ncbi:MAG: glucosidase [Acidobacteria bacterium]|nr:glucosidase [Acidobacteriota bacterium]MCA1650937.1 glucosidase [Acidobacteriota bacterium]